ncbi:DUF2281 domain-containing protein [Bythopirellula goksoeyrii]|uniref:DUF2281 domain-containing protein n=1 Tax=Bythopirellula goksoeyrii TaxID=1400387 RepID=A0A5B9QHX0_9BACT|nr:DUF2281 domain-containing protein [Bythopirellula goksoeyrii]QEG37262.1 hypothetical protein Pr1d_46030 [Bythopirellula goksoeyrii]
MATLPTVNAHFDGTVIVPDEPLKLAPGEKLRVTIERAPAESDQPRRSLRGIAKGMFGMGDDFNAPLDCFDEYR